MAESTYSLGWVEFQAEVGFYLGYGRTEANWSAVQLAEIEIIVKAGIRRVYFPPAVQGVEAGYEWSWLRPSTTLRLGASGTDGAITGVTNFDSATFADWENQGVTTDDFVNISSVGAGDTEIAEYSIASVASGAITLDNPSTRTGATVPANGTSLTFRLVRSPANWTLPDGVSRVVGDFHYPAGEYRPGIKIISVSQLLEMRAGFNRTGYADFAAIRYKVSDQTVGSRQEVLFYPEPDAYKILTYEFEVYQGILTDGAPYPQGGMKLSELYIVSCLAVAEQRGNGENGINTQLFPLLLADAIARDRKQTAQNFGPMGNTETGDLRRFRRGLTGTSYSYSYEGTRIL